MPKEVAILPQWNSHRYSFRGKAWEKQTNPNHVWHDEKLAFVHQKTLLKTFLLSLSSKTLVESMVELCESCLDLVCMTMINSDWILCSWCFLEVCEKAVPPMVWRTDHPLLSGWIIFALTAFPITVLFRLCYCSHDAYMWEVSFSSLYAVCKCKNYLHESMALKGKQIELTQKIACSERHLIMT